MSDEQKKTELTQRDLYNILLDTRNFEIKLFWERANYFLVLNTAIAVGYFNVRDPFQQLIVALIGLFSAYLWLRVCLGGRFWQAKWEGAISKFETDCLDGVRFFSSTDEENISDAEKGLGIEGLYDKKRKIKKWIYEYVIKEKPSVSYSMIRLSVVFVFGWFLLGLYCVYHVGMNLLGYHNEFLCPYKDLWIK